ncbi:MAG: DNA mismatch repair protein MutS, partial [Candidatus Heimdallarchaeaceae archaeon]
MKRVDNRKKKDNLTPMQRQWIEIKNKYPDYIIFWRLGDFYETFREDAKIASKALNITLTSRKTADSEWELAGVPHHAVDSYLARMVDQGFKIAVVEQLEDPSKAKKIVRRGVVRLVSKGTVTAPESLGKANNYLVS